MAVVWMSLQNGVRRGEQRPRIELRPANISSFELGVDAAWVMEQVGKALLPWQEYVVSLILAQRSDGRFAAFETALNVPRQNGKNVVVEARELYGLFLDPDCKTITHSAHEYRTAKNAFEIMQALVRHTPMLWSRVLGSEGKHYLEDVRGIRNSAAEMSITLNDGSKLRYQTRSKDGGRGLTGDVVILDEAYDLTSDEIAAMMPTMAARSENGSPQIIYTSSAGMLSSQVWESIRDRGIAGDEERLLYLEWSADDGADSGDVDALYQANPSLGYLISEEYVRQSELKALPDEQFRRERLGIWARVGDESGLSGRQWARQLDEASVPGERVFFGLDVAPSRDSAAITVVSERDDGRLHVELVEHRVGTDWVVGRAKELQQAWAPAAFVVDAGSAAGALVGELQRHRVRITQVTGRDYLQACGLIYDEFQAGNLAHIGQDPLDEAVGNVKIKPKGESLFTWVRIDPSVTIGPWVAATLALAGLNMKKRHAPRSGGKSGWRVVAL